jgi:manganese transport protein
MAAAADLPPDAPHSLEDIHGSVPIPPATWWRRFLAFSGPAFLVSVGYMDPGNWGTDLEAGARFGYRLLWVLLLSNLMAVLLQTLATRLGVVTGRDLAQACRDAYPRPTAVALWVLCEVAIAATDLAEVVGAVIALKLLFGVPYLWGLVIAAGDTFLLLALQRRGVRWLELVTLLLIAVIGGSFVVEIWLAAPVWSEVARGFLPTLDATSNEQLRACLYAAIGMLGATVMPHNLYLHSALVQTRSFAPTAQGKRLALRYNFFDSLLALNGAFFVNAAILVLAVSIFFNRGKEFESLQQAYKLLGAVWGTVLAGKLFAVALLASGQSSTLTGTLAGQVVMEGFVRLRLRPWVRRLVTRSLAIAPALVVVALSGHGGGAAQSAGEDTRPAVVDSIGQPPGEPDVSEATDPADRRLLELLVFSQVVLSFQLPFAIVPLLQFTSDRQRMGAFANGAALRALAWACAAVVVGLNAVLLYLQVEKWAAAAGDAGWSPWWVYGTAVPVALAGAGFLAWVALYPRLARREEARAQPETPALPAVRYRRVGVAVEFVPGDEAVLTQAAALARGHGAEVVLLHVVEGTGADIYGPAADDLESRSDRARIGALAQHLRNQGLSARAALGYGEPFKELLRLAGEEQLDLLVVGTHGHRLLGDLALGQTVAPLLHRSTVPILVVPTAPRGSSVFRKAERGGS